MIVELFDNDGSLVTGSEAGLSPHVAWTSAGGEELEFYYHGRDRDILILAADGGLSRHNAHQFIDDLEEYVENGARKLVVDCTRLTYISSVGVGVLVTLSKRMSKIGGEVKLASVKSRVIDILRITTLDRIFEIYPNLEAAIDSFQS